MRPRIAYFSPLPPNRSGIADYSAELLPALAAHAEIHLVTDGTPPEGALARDFRHYPVTEFAATDARERYDLCLFQFGNHPCHHYMYPVFLERSGVVVLHEWVMHHFFWELYVKAGQGREYLREVRACHGDTAAQELARSAAGHPDPALLFKYPLVCRFVRGARGVIAHSEYVANRARQLAPGVPVAVVKHHALPPSGPPPTDEERRALRRQLSLPSEGLLLVSPGYATAAKRLDVAVAACAGLVAAGIDAHLVVVGEVDPGFDLMGLAARYGLEGRVRARGYVPFDRLREYIRAADVCLNLRHPTAGETSGSAIRVLGEGQPLVVSNQGWFAEIPDDCAVKIDVGADEVEHLAAALRLLAERPDLRAMLGHNAAAYVQEEHTLERSAAGYAAFVASVLERGETADGPRAAAEPPRTREREAERAIAADGAGPASGNQGRGRRAVRWRRVASMAERAALARYLARGIGADMAALGFEPEDPVLEEIARAIRDVCFADEE